jgi:alpha-D-xyloside xylohydrolase
VLQRPVDGKYQYEFGDFFLIAPIYEDSPNRIVDLPEGKWRYMFNDQELTEGPVSIEREFPMDEYPVYIREGAIIPLQVTRPYTGYGDSTSSEYLTVLVYPGKESSFRYNQLDGEGKIDISVRLNDSVLEIHLVGDRIPHILRIFQDKRPGIVKLDGLMLEEGRNWQYDAVDKRLIIKTECYQQGIYVIQ